jgi:DNA repair protein RadD
MAMRLKPRDYQEFAAASVFEFFGKHPGEDRHPIVAMPTGTGKSVVIADLLWKILSMWCTQRILVLTHVKELIEQNYDKFITMWPEAPAGVYSAGLGRRDTRQNVIFGGIASVYKAMHLFGRFDLVFVDECHLVNPEEEGMYRNLFKYLKGLNKDLKIVGFTATPWKLGHGSLVENGIFTDICCDMTGVEAFNWLIAQGYLMPLIPKRTGTVLDIAGVHMQAGDFKSNELQTAVDKEHVTRAALNEAIELGADRHHWLIFAAGVDHACHIADMLNFEFNIPAIAIHGKMGKEARDNAIRDYKAGKYRVAVNNNVLTTGFDFPGIDLILMLRPTASAVLWVQMLGRGTRPSYAPGFDINTLEGRLAAIAASAKHNCLVLDFAGNTRRLGPINDPLVPKKKGEKGGTAPVKECDACGTYNHASARHCINCGTEFLIQTKLKQAASTQELVKGDSPIVEVFAVDQITMQRYTKGDTSMARVTYYCGLKMFTEYVGIDHPAHNMRTKARQWLRDRGAKDIPETTDALMAMSTSLNAPTHLRVWINQKYPSILAACFDGTAWGKEESPRAAPPVQVDSIPRSTKSYPRKLQQQHAQDTDIPFTDEEIVAMGGARPSVPFADLDDDIPF